MNLGGNLGPASIGVKKKHEEVPLGVRKDKEDKRDITGGMKEGEENGIAGTGSVFSEGSCEVEVEIHWGHVALTLALRVIESCAGGRFGGKSPSFDIQIIFRDSNKKLVPCGPLGSGAATICSSSASPSSDSPSCISSPTERVSALCYFKANAARGPFSLSQAAAAACSLLVQPTVGTGARALCLPPSFASAPA